MPTATTAKKKPTDLRSQVVASAADRKARDLQIIRAYIAARADDQPFGQSDVDALVDAMARHRLDIETLDGFVEAMLADRGNAGTLANHESALAELGRQGVEASNRKAEIEKELVQLRNKIAWVTTMRANRIEDFRQAKALRQANPLLFADDVDAALAPREAVTADKVAKLIQESPRPLSNFGT